MVTKRKYTKNTYKSEAKKPIDRSRFTAEENSIPKEWGFAAVDNPKRYIVCPQCTAVMDCDKNFRWKKSKNTVGVFATLRCENDHLNYSESLGGLLLKCGGVFTEKELRERESTIF